MEEIKTKLKEAITLIAEASNGLTEASNGLTQMTPFDDHKHFILTNISSELSNINRKLEDIEDNL